MTRVAEEVPAELPLKPSSSISSGHDAQLWPSLCCPPFLVKPVVFLNDRGLIAVPAGTGRDGNDIPGGARLVALIALNQTESG